MSFRIFIGVFAVHKFVDHKIVDHKIVNPNKREFDISNQKSISWLSE